MYSYIALTFFLNNSIISDEQICRNVRKNIFFQKRYDVSDSCTDTTSFILRIKVI